MSATLADTGYEADPDPALPNPERGIYYAPGAGEGYHTIVAEWLYLGTVCDEPLTWAGLDDAATSPVLDAYATRLEQHRKTGMKVLFRPRYDVPGNDELRSNRCGVFHAASKQLQLDHIAAIAAMLGAFRDVIAFVEAGYLGRWGEWNTHGYPRSAAPLLYSTADRNAILDRMLASYAAHGLRQHVNVRRPVFAREVLLRNPAARIGLHNDSFMTNADDVETYDDFEPDNPARFGTIDAAKTWARSLTATASFGGETSPLATDPADPAYGTERWRTCRHMTGAASEPAALHLSYLHGAYATDAKPTWVAGGCYDEIRRRLGYRFEVSRVEYTPTITVGAQVVLVVELANTGWSRLHKPRHARLVLREGSVTHVYDVEAGAVDSWAPGATMRLSVTAPAPSAGTYSVRLWIPDPDAPVGDTYAHTRIMYAVRLATLRDGTNVFDATTGENDLGVSITVT